MILSFCAFFLLICFKNYEGFVEAFDYLTTEINFVQNKKLNAPIPKVEKLVNSGARTMLEQDIWCVSSTPGSKAHNFYAHKKKIGTCDFYGVVSRIIKVSIVSKKILFGWVICKAVWEKCDSVIWCSYFEPKNPNEGFFQSFGLLAETYRIASCGIVPRSTVQVTTICPNKRRVFSK